MIDRDNLNRLIEKARNAPPMTEEELRRQRESWVRGEMALGLDRDEAAWRAANMPKETP